MTNHFLSAVRPSTHPPFQSSNHSPAARFAQAAKRLRFLQRLFSVASADGNVVDMVRFESLELRSYYDVVNFLQMGFSERSSDALRRKCSYPFNTAEHPIARVTLWRLDRELQRCQVELMLAVNASEEAVAEARGVVAASGLAGLFGSSRDLKGSSKSAS